MNLEAHRAMRREQIECWLVADGMGVVEWFESESKGRGFFRNAFSTSSSRMRFLASRSSRAPASRSGSPETSRRRLAAHLSTVLGLSPSSRQQAAVGLPVEMM